MTCTPKACRPYLKTRLFFSTLRQDNQQTSIDKFGGDSSDN